ncbi:MAG: hypothetical protein JXR26_12065, partial [Balneolaceae bacterium]|nr:hypothetical protein [Balneolaceae bacterium]
SSGADGPGDGGSSDGSGEGGTTAEAEAFEDRIIDSELKPCMQNVMSQLQLISQGVGKIIQDFAIDEIEPDIENFNWEVKDGDLDSYENAETLVEYNENTNTVTTIFDTDKFGSASNLAIARTIMHEAIHAYMVSLQYSQKGGIPLSAAEKERLLGPDWAFAFGDSYYGHKYIADNYLDGIATALNAYGNGTQGHSLGYRYYKDLSWGGLTNDANGTEYDFFKKIVDSASDRERIKNNIAIEQVNKDLNGNYKSQKGNDAGC